MDLTPDVKRKIDKMNYAELLAHWRFAPSGDPMFRGDSSKYFSDRMNKLRVANPSAAVAASKLVGW